MMLRDWRSHGDKSNGWTPANQFVQEESPKKKPQSEKESISENVHMMKCIL